MINNGVEVKQILQSTYVSPYSPYDGEWTKTTQFMLPAININVKNHLLLNFFVNAYLDDKNHEHSYTRPIFLLFSVNSFSNPNWIKVYNIMIKSPNYITDYDCGFKDDKSLIMLVFSVPEEFERDYYLFKLGRYSEFSSQYKSKFPRYLNEKSQKDESIIWQVINKSNTLKRTVEEMFNMPYGEMDKVTDGVKAKELWDIPRKEREYYNYKT